MRKWYILCWWYELVSKS